MDQGQAIVVAALIGASGVVIGGLITLAITALTETLRDKRARKYSSRDQIRAALQNALQTLAKISREHEVSKIVDSEPELNERIAELGLWLSRKDASTIQVFFLQCLSSILMDKGKEAQDGPSASNAPTESPTMNAQSIATTILPAWFRESCSTQDVRRASRAIETNDHALLASVMDPAI